MKNRSTIIKTLQVSVMLFAISGITAQTADYMNIYLVRQNMFQSVAIDDVKKITFASEDEATLQLAGGVTAMAIDNIGVITFGDSDITSVEESIVEENKVTVNYYPATAEVKVVSTEAIGMVQLYNLQGVLMQSKVLQTNEVILNLANYPQGVYIVAVQSGSEVITEKIIKN